MPDTISNSEIYKTLGASREKYWKELTDSEKIDRMRIVVKRLQESLIYISNQIDDFPNHIHNSKGEAIVENRLGQVNIGKAGMIMQTSFSKDSDEVFF